MDCSKPGSSVLYYLPEFAQIHVHWVCDAIQQSHPLSHPSLALNLSSIRVFSNELGLCIKWPNYWSFRFSNSTYNEYSGLISFRIGLFDHLAVEGTLKSLQYHNSKSSNFWHSAFFAVNVSHPHMITGKDIALITQIFVSKVMSLLFNTLYVCHRLLFKEQAVF